MAHHVHHLPWWKVWKKWTADDWALISSGATVTGTGIVTGLRKIVRSVKNRSGRKPESWDINWRTGRKKKN
jgi:hypothetical protein